MKPALEDVVRPGMVVHGYRIERKLGVGGFSLVYLAWQGERPYALKFMRLKDAEHWAKRELTILLHLQHPNVVKLVGHVTGPAQTPEYLVLVMEFVSGRTLYDWAEEENPSAREVARLMLKLCRALGAVHAAQVLHRDFKGSNVLVRDAGGEPVLVDFGVSAVPWAPRVTRGGMAPGTPSYRSPECVRFIVNPERLPGAPYPYSAADDLYALGVTLYVLLTGLYPFYGFDEWELMREIAQEVPQSPHEYSRRVPRALSELCMRLLEKEPSARFPSAEAVAEILEAMLAEADASWDMPLCDGWDAAGLFIENEPGLVPLDAEERGRGRACMRPRRGRKPPPADAPAPPAAVPVPPPPPVAPAPPAEVSPGRPVRALARERLLRAGGTCGLLVVGLGGAHLLFAQSQQRDTTFPSAPVPAGPTLTALLRASFPDEESTAEACFVREVASPWKQPEAGTGAAPARADTPAPVIAMAMLSKGEVRVKREQRASSSQAEKKGSGSDLARWCVGAAAAANVACPGAQVRTTPVPQACPDGAVKTMTEKLGLEIGATHGVDFPGYRERKPVPVQQGPTALILAGDWGNLPSETALHGWLYFGEERVYGRLTEARPPGSGETFPICLELHDIEGGRGAKIESNGGKTVKVFPIAKARAVDRFE